MCLDNKWFIMSNKQQDVFTMIGNMLKEHDLQPTPTNYSVLYRYFESDCSELNKDIDVYITQQTSLDEHFMQDMHSEYILPPDTSINDAFSALQSLVGNVQTAVSASSKDNENFLDSLQNSSAQLYKPSANLEKILNFLQNSTESFICSQEELNNRLQLAESESQKLRSQLDETSKAAMNDDLTGLLNRKGMKNKISQLEDDTELSFQEHECSIIAFDLDHFKVINDTYGHLFGDKVLSQTGQVIAKHVRGADIAVRFGGEEFIVILPDTQIEGAVLVAEKIRKNMEKLNWVNKRTGEKLGSITISAGIGLKKPGQTLEEGVQTADEALYTAKEQGRNQCFAN